MHGIRIGVLGMCLLSSLAYAQSPSADEQAILQVLEAQVTAWNQGDIRGFMQGYWQSDSLRFASGDQVHYGWRAVLTRYLRTYNTPQKMGTLSFTELQVQKLGARSALVFGRWQLQRADDTLQGLFTLIFKKTPEGWRIVHDHTSSSCN